MDVLVSEPMGTLLVNERMLETYLYARDHFLRPGGKMLPVSGGAVQGRGWQVVQRWAGCAVRRERPWVWFQCS